MEIEVYQQANDLKGKHWWFLGRKQVISSVLTRYLKTGSFKILDAGCGAATSLPILTTFGKLYGVDKAKKAIKFCQKKGYTQLKRGSVASLPFADKTFNLVAALDLLEHLKNDQKAISEFSRVCKKGGWLVITVPAFSFLWGENDIAAHHFRRYEKGELKRKIEKSGFKIKKLSYFNFFLFPLFLVWHLARLVKRKIIRGDKARSTLSIGLPSLINKFFALLFSQEARFLPAINFPFGLSLICLAQKE